MEIKTCDDGYCVDFMCIQTKNIVAQSVFSNGDTPMGLRDDILAIFIVSRNLIWKSVSFSIIIESGRYPQGLLVTIAQTSFAIGDGTASTSK